MDRFENKIEPTEHHAESKSTKLPDSLQKAVNQMSQLDQLGQLCNRADNEMETRGRMTLAELQAYKPESPEEGICKANAIKNFDTLAKPSVNKSDIYLVSNIGQNNEHPNEKLKNLSKQDMDNLKKVVNDFSSDQYKTLSKGYIENQAKESCDFEHKKIDEFSKRIGEARKLEEELKKSGKPMASDDVFKRLFPEEASDKNARYTKKLYLGEGYPYEYNATDIAKFIKDEQEVIDDYQNKIRTVDGCKGLLKNWDNLCNTLNDNTPGISRHEIFKQQVDLAKQTLVSMAKDGKSAELPPEIQVRLGICMPEENDLDGFVSSLNDACGGKNRFRIDVHYSDGFHGEQSSRDADLYLDDKLVATHCLQRVRETGRGRGF